MRGLIIAMSLALAGCAASGARSGADAPDVAASFDAREFRQPAIFVRVDVRTAQLSTRDASDAPGEYQGLLLEGLNAKAVVPRDLTLVPEREALDRRSAVARAREVGADHVLLVDVAISRRSAPYCRGAFTADTLTVVQRVVVVRTSDEAELSSEVVDERERRRTLLGEVCSQTPRPRWQPGERYATHVEGYHHDVGRRRR